MVKGRAIEEKLRALRGGRLLFLPNPDEWSADWRVRKNPMKCLHCQGTMKRGRAPIHIDRNGCHVTIDNVPAWICEPCGEPLFEEREVEAIQDIIKAVDEKCRRLQRSA